MSAAIYYRMLLRCYLFAATKDGGRKHEENVSNDFSVENPSRSAGWRCMGGETKGRVPQPHPGEVHS